MGGPFWYEANGNPHQSLFDKQPAVDQLRTSWPHLTAEGMGRELLHAQMAGA